jgi:hypothetical protein
VRVQQSYYGFSPCQLSLGSPRNKLPLFWTLSNMLRASPYLAGSLKK